MSIISKSSRPWRRGRSHPESGGPRFSGGHTRVQKTETRSLRIITFNVKFSRYIDRALELFEKMEAFQDLDILALQEMDESGVEKIAHRFHLNYVYYPAVVHSVHGRNFGNALLSPWPITEDQKIFLPHPQIFLPHPRMEKMQRIAVGATFIRGRQKLRAYSLHLGTVMEILPRQRKEQVNTVLADAARFSCPIVMVGDMNARGIGRFVEKQGYIWATKKVRSTISLFAWDHIFIRGFGQDPVMEVGVVRDNRKASDHKPVWMVLRLDQPSGPAVHRGQTLLSDKVLLPLRLPHRLVKK